MPAARALLHTPLAASSVHTSGSVSVHIGSSGRGSTKSSSSRPILIVVYLVSLVVWWQICDWGFTPTQHRGAVVVAPAVAAAAATPAPHAAASAAAASAVAPTVAPATAAPPTTTAVKAPPAKADAERAPMGCNIPRNERRHERNPQATANARAPAYWCPGIFVGGLN